MSDDPFRAGPVFLPIKIESGDLSADQEAELLVIGECIQRGIDKYSSIAKDNPVLHRMLTGMAEGAEVTYRTFKLFTDSDLEAMARTVDAVAHIAFLAGIELGKHNIIGTPTSTEEA